MAHMKFYSGDYSNYDNFQNSLYITNSNTVSNDSHTLLAFITNSNTKIPLLTFPNISSELAYIGITSAQDRNYQIQRDTAGRLFVNIPWTDTTYSVGSYIISYDYKPQLWSGEVLSNWMSYTMSYIFEQQSDWEETNTDSFSYIKNKPSIYTQTEINSLLGNKQDTLVSGTDIKTIDGTSLLGSGDITIGVQEIDASVTISGSTPSNYVFTINNYADFYNAIVAAKTAGKIPVSRMVVNAGNWTITLVGIISNKTQTTFTTSFQDSGTGIYMSEFNSPSASTPYRIQYVEQQEKLVSGTNIKTINNTSILGLGDISLQTPLVSGINIKTINGNSILGNGNLSISGGLIEAYGIVDADLLYLDQTQTYYEVPSTVFTSLKAIWDANKVPILTCSLNTHAIGLTLIPTYFSFNSTFQCFWHGTTLLNGNNWHLSGTINSTGGRFYIEKEQEPITVDQTVQSSSQNPVSGAAVYNELGEIDDVLDAILGSQVISSGTETVVHTNESTSYLNPEKIHVYDGTIDTLSIILNAPTDEYSHLYTIIFTTGTTPIITIQTSDSTSIIYPDDYVIKTNMTYEISVLYVNEKYYLRFVNYQESES